MHVPVALALNTHPPIHLVFVTPHFATLSRVLVYATAVLIHPGAVLVPIGEGIILLLGAVQIIYVIMHGRVSCSLINIGLKNVRLGVIDFWSF